MKVTPLRDLNKWKIGGMGKYHWTSFTGCPVSFCVGLWIIVYTNNECLLDYPGITRERIKRRIVGWSTITKRKKFWRETWVTDKVYIRDCLKCEGCIDWSKVVSLVTKKSKPKWSTNAFMVWIVEPFRKNFVFGERKYFEYFGCRLKDWFDLWFS